MPRARTITTNDFARVIDVTPDYVRKLTQKGIVQGARDEEGNDTKGRYNLLAVRDYWRYLRGLTRHEDEGEQRYFALRNERMAAESAMARIRLYEMKSQFHRSDDIEWVLSQLFAAVRRKLSKIPEQVTRLVLGKKNFQEVFDLIQGVIYTVLRELSNMNAATIAPEAEQYLAATAAKEGANGEAENKPRGDW
jgi:hypothetical protein